MVLRTSWPCGSIDKTTLYLIDSGMENVRCSLFEKTKTGSARKRSAPRPNLLDAPAGHEVFVKRRYCFAPARRRPIDQLDWGSPAESRRIARKDGVSKLVQLPVPPHRRTGKKEMRKAKESFRIERKRRGGHGAKNWATVSKPDKLDLL